MFVWVGGGVWVFMSVGGGVFVCVWWGGGGRGGRSGGVFV